MHSCHCCDYAHFTWVTFLKETNEAFSYKNTPIVFIRSDQGRDFDQKEFIEFCINDATAHNFSAPRAP